MGWKFECERALVWSQQEMEMRPGFRLVLQMVGNLGSVFAERVGYCFSLGEVEQRRGDLEEAILTDLGMYRQSPVQSDQEGEDAT